MQSNRTDAFESLRGIMALWVVLGHVLLTFDTPFLEHSSISRIGSDNVKAVYIFMILSGFVIFHLFMTKKESFLTFISRRWLRLFPCYCVCLLIAIVMLRPSLEAAQNIANISPRNASRVIYLSDSIRYFWPHLIAHLTMLHGMIPNRLLPSTDYAFIGQAWSISVEWQFYLLAPLTYALATGQRQRWLGFAGIVVLIVLLGGTKSYLGQGYIGSYVPYFALGAASSFYWHADPIWHRPIVARSNLVITFGVLAWVILMRRHWHIAIWIGIFLSCLAARSGAKGAIIADLVVRLLSAKPLRWLGRISYSVYLTHTFFLFGILWLMRNRGMSQPAMLIVTLAGTVAGTLILSTVMYRCVEAPFIDLGRRMRPRGNRLTVQ